MPERIATWDDADSTLVWWTLLDGRYQIEVHDEPSVYPRIIIFDREDEMDIIHQEPVTLAYGAKFGPDIADVHAWQELSIDVVDHPEKRSPGSL